MKTSEIKEKNLRELKKVAGDKAENARKLRFDMAAKQSKNTRGVRNIRKDIARILTIIREKKTNEK